jgi:hypothetical protein
MYGPSHLVVDLSGPTVWSELAAVRQLSESRRLRIIGIVDAGAATPDAAQLASHGIANLLVTGPRLADEIHRWVAGADAETVRSSPAAELPTSAAA